MQVGEVDDDFYSGFEITSFGQKPGEMEGLSGKGEIKHWTGSTATSRGGKSRDTRESEPGFPLRSFR